MSNAPSHLRYTRSHEWIETISDDTYRIGISDHAQDLLGDMVFIELPEAGSTVSASDECAVVESVKAASDVYSPLSGEIIEINEALEDSPDLVNRDPYGDGWLFTVKATDSSELDELMSADEYVALTNEE
ncbi:MAG TPA: glycine cleavage system protein GcvH [Chromatiales bacterium]|nr:glycine cleavage system protein GcvH [Chromatiales bacterium]